MKPLSIGNVEIGKEPKIVSVVWSCKASKWAIESKKCGADLLEVRVDLYKDKDRNSDSIKKYLNEIKSKTSLPVIAAIRRVEQGGLYFGNEKTRKELFDSLINTDYIEAIDIELEAKEIRKEVINKVVKPVIPAKYLDKKARVLINPTGRFVVGGPHGDTGLTGRKIIVDTYGGMGRHGGGAFSGKDPSKVDRSATYMARYIAKNIVAAKIAQKCEVQLSYAIGYPEPVSVLVDCFGTEKISLDKITKLIRKIFKLKPAEIVSHLKLKRPIYQATAAYGHFGRKGKGFTWEKTDKVAILKQQAGI